MRGVASIHALRSDGLGSLNLNCKGLRLELVNATLVNATCNETGELRA